MKTLIAFVLALATPALSYITLSHDYTLEAIHTGKVPTTASKAQLLDTLPIIKVEKEEESELPDTEQTL